MSDIRSCRPQPSAYVRIVYDHNILLYCKPGIASPAGTACESHDVDSSRNTRTLPARASHARACLQVGAFFCGSSIRVCVGVRVLCCSMCYRPIALFCVWGREKFHCIQAALMHRHMGRSFSSICDIWSEPCATECVSTGDADLEHPDEDDPQGGEVGAAFISSGARPRNICRCPECTSF